MDSFLFRFIYILYGHSSLGINGWHVFPGMWLLSSQSVHHIYHLVTLAASSIQLLPGTMTEFVTSMTRDFKFQAFLV